MEKDRVGHDDDEFEMLLGEIPNATSVNTHVNQFLELKSIPIEDRDNGKSPSTSCSFYHSSQATMPPNGLVYNGLGYKRDDEVGSNAPCTQKLHGNGHFCMATNNSFHEQENSNLLDEQSLASVFMRLSYSPIATSDQYKEWTFLPERCLPDSGRETFDPSLARTNRITRFDYRNKSEHSKFMDSRIIESPEAKPTTFLDATDSIRCKFSEQQPSLLPYYGAIPLPPSMDSYDLHQNIPISGLDVPISSYQPQCYLDSHSNPYVHLPNLNAPYSACSHVDNQGEYDMQYFHSLQLQLHRPPLGLTHGPRTIESNLSDGMMVQGSSKHVNQVNQGLILFSNGRVPNGIEPHNLSSLENGTRCFSAKGLSGNGSICHYSSCNFKGNTHRLDIINKRGCKNSPEKILIRSNGMSSLKDIEPVFFGMPNKRNTNGNFFPHRGYHSVSNSMYYANGNCSRDPSPEIIETLHSPSSQQKIYNSLDEITGRIYLVAKDQHGCRFLQRKISEKNPEDIQKIFIEVIDNIVDLMTDPFGNYLVQKLLDVCNEDQRMRILHTCTKIPEDLIRISCDMHGTRSVQKIIETVKTPEEFSIIVTFLKPEIVEISKDINGNHVAQRCLQHLDQEHNEILFESAIPHCLELAEDRHGCCVLQRYLHHLKGEQSCCLMSIITRNALSLAQNEFGNYVIQFIIVLRVPWAMENTFNQLEGNFARLSVQKYSSNVVEKCLKYGTEAQMIRIIQELIFYPRMEQIMMDPFGNYVIQSALSAAKGSILLALMENIKPHIPILRTSDYGKKVLSRMNLK